MFLMILFWLPFLGVLAHDIYSIANAEGEKGFSDVGFLLTEYAPAVVDFLGGMFSQQGLDAFLDLPAWFVTIALGLVVSAFLKFVTYKGHTHKNKVVARAWKR